MVGGQKTSEEYHVLFKMVKSTPQKVEGSQNGVIHSEYTGLGEEHAMVFPISSLARIDVPERQTTRSVTTNGWQTVRFPRNASDDISGTSASFRTDADISGNLGPRERNLQRWEAPPVSSVDMSLESATGGEWDQFKANEQMFGVKSDYDENIYTTRIDRSNPHYAMREREAARIAREIEADVSSNPHVREERGQKDEDLDEESKCVYPTIFIYPTDICKV